jgi:hypothetical protein
VPDELVALDESGSEAGGGAASEGGVTVSAGAGSLEDVEAEAVSLGGAGESAAGAVGVLSAAGAGSETSAIVRVEMATAPGAATASTPPAARAAPPTRQRRQRARVDGTRLFRTAFEERCTPADRRNLLLIRSSFLP